MLDRIVDFLAPSFAGWGYWIVGLATMLENSLGLGLVVPGETLVLLGSFYAGRGELDPVLVAAMAFLGGVVGDNLGYLIGRRAGRSFLERFGHRVFLKPERIAAAERFYARHGGKAVFLGRFVPVVRSVSSLLAGVGRMRYARFAAYDMVGAGLWAVGHTVIGYVVGEQYERFKRYMDGVGLVVLGMLVLLLLVSVWVRRRRARSGLPLRGSKYPEDA